jgi:hypothetical protein
MQVQAEEKVRREPYALGINLKVERERIENHESSSMDYIIKKFNIDVRL